MQHNTQDAANHTERLNKSDLRDRDFMHIAGTF